MEIKLRNISKTYGDFKAVKDVSLEVEDGTILALLGPSGCGKTTLLRMIAGLIPVTSGNIYFNSKDVTTLSPQKRNAAMVFQNYALFPHMDVYNNVAFGLKTKKVAKNLIQRKVNEILAGVELSGLERRRIQELSGGQRQRVALARALVTQPDILLFDEPLSNLDPKLRVTMRQSIKMLQRKLGITTVYVTHDQEEAMAVADKITVMNQGIIQQTDTPSNLYYKPINSFVADFIGHANILPISHQSDSITVLSKTMPLNQSNKDKTYAMIRPENFKLQETGIKGKVLIREDLGLIIRYHIEVLNHIIKVDVLNQTGMTPYMVDNTVFLDFDPSFIHYLSS